MTKTKQYSLEFNLEEYKEYQKGLIGKNRYGYVRMNLPEFYRLYKQDPRKKDDRIPSEKLYRGILETLFIKIWDLIIKENWIFKAPANFGWFYVSESKSTDGFYTDWGKSKDKGEKVKSYNYHTNGLIFYLKWLKLKKLKHKSIYGIDPYRGVVDDDELTGKKGMSHWIFKCAEDPTIKDYRGVVLQ